VHGGSGLGSAPGTYPPGRHRPGGVSTAPLTYLQGAPASFGEAIKQAFRNGFVYRGRASRSAYWWFALFQAIVFTLVGIASIPLAGNNGSGASVAVALIVSFPLLYLELVALALCVRRLHDTDRSGWWILIVLLPYVGAIVLLIFTLLKGSSGPNRYQP
jgi:uncharacterized membrane protein YhaH (DUF805 family)